MHLLVLFTRNTKLHLLSREYIQGRVKGFWLVDWFLLPGISRIYEKIEFLLNLTSN